MQGFKSSRKLYPLNIRVLCPELAGTVKASPDPQLRWVIFYGVFGTIKSSSYFSYKQQFYGK